MPSVFVVGAAQFSTAERSTTYTVVLAETLPDTACIVAEPTETALASPFEPAALLTVATAEFEELHVTAFVRFCVELSEYVPVAVNCWVVPFAIVLFDGETASVTRVAGVTVKDAVPETLPDAALIVVEPAATETARPLDPAALLIVATAVFEELQATVVVSTWVVLSEYVPVATNCLFVPLAMPALAGVTEIETRVADVTVSPVDPDTVPIVAVMVVEPAATGDASPIDPAVLLIVAIPSFEEVQVAAAVTSWVVLSENDPVAVNCCFVPFAMPALAGETEIDRSVAGFTVSVVEPEMLVQVAVIVVVPAPTEVARPFEPDVLLMVATPVSDEVQVTYAVRSCVVPSEKVPVAANCRPVPPAITGFVGVTAIEASWARFTFSFPDPEAPFQVALIVVVPSAIPNIVPRTAVSDAAVMTAPPVGVTDAMAVSEEVQSASAVTSLVELSE